MAEVVNQPSAQETGTPTPPERAGAETAGRAAPTYGENIIAKGWKVYAAEQVQKGRWTQEQLAHPERKLLPEMKSYEIKQGIREGIITEPGAVSTMLQKDLNETRAFWNEWSASHAAERDDATDRAAVMIAAKEEEIQPLLKSPNRQAVYLSRQAERDMDLLETDEDDQATTIRRQGEAANLFDMAARLARVQIEALQKLQEQQKQEQQTQQNTEAQADAVRQELTELAEHPNAA